MAKTLGTLRKEIDLDTASNVVTIARYLVKIIDNDPQALIKVMSERMQNDRPEMMVQFYRDMADYLARTFETR